MSPSSTVPPAPRAHYENFPVASWLCPAPLRPAVAAIYWFARTADDLADEGDAPAHARLADLAAFRAELLATWRDPAAPAGRWPHVFVPLAAARASHALPLAPFTDLLSAFEQDVAFTRDGRRYDSREALLDYCRRSADPVGRLMLHLYGVADATALAESDCVCTALQLANFWQDLSVDLPRRRVYVPTQDLDALGIDAALPAAWASHPEAPLLIATLASWTRATMQKGLNIPHRVPGRAGWELRAVVQGGLRIVEKVEALGARAFVSRPTLAAWEAPLLLWRAARMGQSTR